MPRAYSRDPRYYPDPEAFKPERFLKDGQLNDQVLDPANVAFGYGRRCVFILSFIHLSDSPRYSRARSFDRICPGRFFAEASIFTMLSNILHVFTIEAPKDGKGNAVYFDVNMTNGIVS